MRVGANTAQATPTLAGSAISTPTRRIVAVYGIAAAPPPGRNKQRSSVTEPRMKLVLVPPHSNMPASTCAAAGDENAASAAIAIAEKRIIGPPPTWQVFNAIREKAHGAKGCLAYTANELRTGYFRLPQNRW